MKRVVLTGVMGVALLSAACEGAVETETPVAQSSDVVEEVTVDDLAEKMVSAVEITDLAAADIPVDIVNLVTIASPGLQIGEAQKKVRDGRTYFDVEGETAEGEEIEFDVLMTENGPEIVEIQRDLAWSEVPEIASQAALEVGDVNPVRVIESKQPDGSIIYELFAEGQPGDPAMEVRVVDGVAEVLAERWPH
ncbi:hypothetical protein [Hirschia baltica]|uniref:PepSY domain-containing protein n=1 Tax=Hirschia baltica (strain ATCC 49814 / DSM 5838 / IFAM 1418) TaxID=582402 RepID=C6XQI7_HIRBI|nr:hypothetical protein [Hirschia baltica]ACT60486.1 hypothetical protein Hbal_2813 [Hirschia baltica ATCC 49814]